MGRNRPFTIEEKRQQSLNMKGGNSGSFKKGHVMSDEIKNKISHKADE